MTSKQKAPTANCEGLSDVLDQEQGNDSKSQQKRLLEAMRARGSVSTLEARKELDILCPAARILELKAKGCRIDRCWSIETTVDGREHRVARYVLQASPKSEGLQAIAGGH